MTIPKGYCQCGCGQKTKIADRTRNGYKRGESMKYLYGHLGNPYKNYKSPNKSFGRFIEVYRAIAEKVLGKPLKTYQVVHHVDGDKDNIEHSNLIICENVGYHMTLHRRTRAYKECGHANWLWCTYCQDYDDPENMYVNKNGLGYHRECRKEWYYGMYR